MAYHESRVLLLVNAVASHAGHQRKLDGLTKLAKLDFLVRYPALAPSVIKALDVQDPRLHLSPHERAAPTAVEAPMVRYKYGPWDDRYYSVVGALVGKGLLRFTRGRRGSVALKVTGEGRELSEELARTSTWAEVADRCAAVADATKGMTGTALKDAIYLNLNSLMDRPHREVIR
jgi:hypothetical protein